MPRRLQALAKGAGPLLVVAGLALLDHASNGPATAPGILLGATLVGLIAALGAWGSQRLRPLAQALQLALISVAELAAGVMLVYLLAAPLTALLPQPWVLLLMRDDRATDLMVLLFLGVALMLVARALRRASRHEARSLESARDAALVRAELAERDRELARAELQLLRAQVEPHFLWNTLANVEYLIRKDPPRAQTMLTHMIGYLRGSVPQGEGAVATLGSEFASLQDYLGLMAIRMGDRLTFNLCLSPACAGVPFPPLVLQTLVENAIKHGLEPLTGPAHLRVVAEIEPDRPDGVAITVIDNGVGLSANPATRGTGLGLRNVRDRLQAMRGQRAALSIRGRDEGGVCARIVWPMAAE